MASTVEESRPPLSRMTAFGLVAAPSVEVSNALGEFTVPTLHATPLPAGRTSRSRAANHDHVRFSRPRSGPDSPGGDAPVHRSMALPWTVHSGRHGRLVCPKRPGGGDGWRTSLCAMALRPDEFYAHAIAAADAEQRLPL